MNRQIVLLLDKDLILKDNYDFVDLAVRLDHLDTVKLLIEASFYIDRPIDDIETTYLPLQTAIECHASIEIIKTLLNRSANINSTALLNRSNGRTPLISFAIYNNRLDLIMLLLQRRANITIQAHNEENYNSYFKDGRYYRSALEAAICSEYPENTSAVIQLLDNDTFAIMIEGGLEVTLGGRSQDFLIQNSILRLLLVTALERRLNVQHDAHLSCLRIRMVY